MIRDDDESVWFTTEDPVGLYEEPMRMDHLKFPCTQSNGSQESNNKR